MTFLREQVAGEGWALLTDLYELTMAYGFWKHDMAEREAAFHLTFREHPFSGSYTVAAGLQTMCEMLHGYQYSSDELQYLASLLGGDGQPLFSPAFLDLLAELRFSCDVDAVPEGTVVFPHEPLVRVQGPLLQAQVIESLLLNVINFQTLIATKAARIVRAAAPGGVLEFGLRRAQGQSGALLASRAAYVGGCVATSNVLAGKRYDIPVRGTHAHSWVMAFDSEPEAFARYASVMPNNCIFLVDTYDTRQGVSYAIEVAQQLREQGHTLIGVRLDSGDLRTLSCEAREMLDAAGLEDAMVVATNDLDEYEIQSLQSQGARIDLWGVGTRLATAYDQPALGGVYKLSALRDEQGSWQPKLKLSEEPTKTSTPGILQTRRYWQDGQPVADVTFDLPTGIDAQSLYVIPGSEPQLLPQHTWSEDLLVPVFRRGELVYQHPTAAGIRARTLQQLRDFLGDPTTASPQLDYEVGLEQRLWDQKVRLARATTEARS